MLLDRHLIISRARCNVVEIIGINSAEIGDKVASVICFLTYLS